MRYEVVNIAWRPVGERHGLLRRRRVQMRSQVIGRAKDIEAASELLAMAPMYCDEAVFVYDHENHGLTCAAKYGWRWNKP